MSDKRNFNPPREELERLYQTLSMKQIAKHYGVGETVVHKRIHEHGIVLEGVGKGGHRKKTGKIFSKEHLANLSKAHSARLAGLAPELRPNWKGGPVQIQCAYPPCGKLFTVVRARKDTARYCCHSHRSKHLNQGEQHPKWRDDADRTPKTCALPDCGKVFGPEDCGNIAIFRNRKFCSKACADIGGLRYEGEAHPRYKPDSRRRSPRGKQGAWERKVKSRDHNTCQDCGATDRPLHAHHIVEFVDSVELRWEVSNGVTLCDDCHLKRHGWVTSDAPVEKVHNGIRQRRWEGNCEWCGEFISRRWSDARGKAHLFCGRPCASKWRARVKRTFDPPREELEHLYQTLSMKQIAEHYGVGQSAVHKLIHEHGIVARRNWQRRSQQKGREGFQPETPVERV